MPLPTSALWLQNRSHKLTVTATAMLPIAGLQTNQNDI